jgi:hypothetical protein
VFFENTDEQAGAAACTSRQSARSFRDATGLSFRDLREVAGRCASELAHDFGCLTDDFRQLFYRVTGFNRGKAYLSTIRESTIISRRYQVMAKALTDSGLRLD